MRCPNQSVSNVHVLENVSFIVNKAFLQIVISTSQKAGNYPSFKVLEC